MFFSCILGKAQVPDTTAIIAIYNTGDSLANYNLEEALKVYEKAHLLSIRSSFTAGLYRYMQGSARFYSKKGDFAKADSLLQRQVDMAAKNKDRGQQAKAYIEIANNFHRKGKYDKEAANLLKAASILQQVKDTINLRVVYGNISSVYARQKMFDEAFRYIWKSMHDQRGKPELATNYLQLADIHGYAENTDSAIYWYRKALVVTRELDNQYMESFALVNLAEKLHQKNTDTALLLVKQGLAICEKIDLPEGVIKANIILTKCFIQKKRFGQALQISKALQTNKELTLAADDQQANLENQYTAYVGLGDLKTAVGVRDKIRILDDSLKLADLRQQLIYFSDNDRKMQQQAVLLEKDATLTHRKFLLTLSLSGILALLIAGSFYYVNSRRKQQLKDLKIKTMEAEQEFSSYKSRLSGRHEERIRISREIHDELGASLTTISLLTELLKKRLNAAENPEVAKISATSGEMVDKLNEIVWVLNTSNDTINSLVAYIHHFANNFLEDAGIRLQFNAPEEMDMIPIEGGRRRNIYLTVKEAINNIAKHSKADKATIWVAITSGLYIRILDNGVGLHATQNQFSNGLQNMKKRMEEIGGTFQINSERGTSIELFCKLN